MKSFISVQLKHNFLLNFSKVCN